jgi:hypothetical protein
VKTVLLGCVIAALAAMLFSQWQDWDRSAAVNAMLKVSSDDVRNPRAISPLIPSASLIGPIRGFRSIAERPLFDQNRAPPARPEQAKAPEQADAPKWELTAIIAAGDQSQALLSLPDGKTVKLKVGEKHQQWVLEGIADDSVTLTRRGRTTQYKLRDFSSTSFKIGQQ